MSNSMPPPPGATLVQSKSRDIAKDPNKLKKSYNYWSARFKEISEDLFGKGETPGLKLLENTPHYCLSSMDNIARHVFGPNATVEKLHEGIEKFHKIGNAQNDPFTPPWLRNKLIRQNKESVQRAIRAVREIYDGCRRYLYCKKNSEEFQIPVYELLALYFQEGAFAVTPPESSFPYAPLIKTISQENKCRTSKVTLSYKMVERPGFNLVYKPLYANNKDDLRYESLTWNLLVIGGLDVIVNGGFLVKNDIFRLRVINNIYDNIKPALGTKDMKEIAAGMLAGLAVAKIEELSVSYRDKPQEINWKLFYKEVEEEFKKLIEWHKSDIFQYKDKKYAYIKGQLCFHEDGSFKGDDIYGCLRVQAQWYFTRQFPFTLLAYQDRQEQIKTYPTLATFTFSPFVTYMRFHAGEHIFIYLLMSYVIVNYVNKILSSNNSTKEEKNLCNKIKSNKREWYKDYIEGSDEIPWHYVGLGMESDKNKDIDQNEKEKKAAQIVKELFDGIGKFGVINDKLNSKLEELDYVVGFKTIKNACNNFKARLQHYEAAVEKAGLNY